VKIPTVKISNVKIRNANFPKDEIPNANFQNAIRVKIPKIKIHYFSLPKNFKKLPKLVENFLIIIVVVQRSRVFTGQFAAVQLAAAELAAAEFAAAEFTAAFYSLTGGDKLFSPTAHFTPARWNRRSGFRKEI